MLVWKKSYSNTPVYRLQDGIVETGANCAEPEWHTSARYEVYQFLRAIAAGELVETTLPKKKDEKLWDKDHFLTYRVKNGKVELFLDEGWSDSTDYFTLEAFINDIHSGRVTPKIDLLKPNETY